MIGSTNPALRAAITTGLAFYTLPALAGTQDAPGTNDAIRAAASKAWKFEQNSTNDGPFSILISESAIKMSCPRQSMVCIARAPTWEVLLLNTKEKVGMIFPLLRWKNTGYHIGEKLDPVHTSGEVPEQWKNMPAARRTLTSRALEPLRNQYEMLYRGGNARSDSAVSTELLFERFTKLVPEEKTFLCGLYRLSAVSGIMLQRIHHYANGRSDETLGTQSFSRVKVTSSDFETTIKYRKVNNRDEVEMAAKQRKDMAGVYEDLFTGESKPAAAPAKQK